MTDYKNRILGHGVEPLDGILFNPMNWRIHPGAQQQALEGVLDTVGWVQDVIVNKRTGHLVDGHLRCQVAARNGDKTIPVVYVDLSEEEESLVLATIDPIAAMAATDRSKLDDLLQSVQSDDERVQALIDGLSGFNVQFDAFDGEGDGGGSRMANGTKLRIVFGPLMFDIEDADHKLYKWADEIGETGFRKLLDEVLFSTIA